MSVGMAAGAAWAWVIAGSRVGWAAWSSQSQVAIRNLAKPRRIGGAGLNAGATH